MKAAKGYAFTGSQDMVGDAEAERRCRTLMSANPGAE